MGTAAENSNTDNLGNEVKVLVTDLIEKQWHFPTAISITDVLLDMLGSMPSTT